MKWKTALTDICDVGGVAVVRDEGAGVLAVDLEQSNVRVACSSQELLVGGDLQAVHLCCGFGIGFGSSVGTKRV